MGHAREGVEANSATAVSFSFTEVDDRVDRAEADPWLCLDNGGRGQRVAVATTGRRWRLA